MKKSLLMTYSNTEGLEKLLSNENIKVDIKSKPKQEELVNLIKDYDGILIRSEVKITKDIIENAKKLKVICRAGTGVDNVDIKEATKKGIVVMNVPGGNTISACEHTIGLILSIMRNIPQACNRLKSGFWEREKFVGSELQGKTLGLIGIGRIGKEVAKRLISFGMKVIAYDPYVSEEYAKQIGAELKTLDEVLSTSDIISIHSPLNESTRNLINKESISKMKQSVKIVNCARGGIINENDLYEALKTKRIDSAALDVFEKEPSTNLPLFELPNVVVTPHLGASTEEAQIKIAQEVSDMLIDYFEKGIIRNAVNIQAIDLETYEKIKPYITLLEKMGDFLGQIVEGGIKEISIQYNLNFNQPDMAILTPSLLKTILQNFTDITLNIVNSYIYAKERGIKITETKTNEQKEFKEFVNIKVVSEKETVAITGTIYANDKYRIVEINDLDTDIDLTGYLIFIINKDKPGIIGKIGTLLGENSINIGKMFVARNTNNSIAFTFINVDNEVPLNTLNDITSIDGIFSAKFIKIK